MLKVAIRQIREALSDDPKSPRFIETAHRRGYRFIGEIEREPHRVRTRAAGLARPPARRIASADAADRIRRARRTRCRGCTGGSRRRGGGERQVVFVTGEAGIGKTTLLDTFARSVATDPAVRICQRAVPGTVRDERSVLAGPRSDAAVVP